MKPMVLICALLLALAACGAPPDPQAPVAVVRGFVAGLEARDATQILAQLPPDQTRRRVAPEVRSYLSAIERLEFRDPVYTVLENSGSLARIRLTATMAYTIRGAAPGERPIDAVFEVARSGEAWYLESVAWPDLGGE